MFEEDEVYQKCCFWGAGTGSVSCSSASCLSLVPCCCCCFSLLLLLLRHWFICEWCVQRRVCVMFTAIPSQDTAGAYGLSLIRLAPLSCDPQPTHKPRQDLGAVSTQIYTVTNNTVLFRGRQEKLTNRKVDRIRPTKAAVSRDQSRGTTHNPQHRVVSPRCHFEEDPEL